jgi:hypothetical protein
MKPANAVLIVLIVLTLLAAPAGATMTYYSNQASWEAATSDVFTIDFNDVVVPDNPGFVDYSTTGLQLHDVTFTANPATESGLWVIMSGSGTDSVYPNAFGAGNYVRGNTWDTKYFQAALPASVNAVALRLMTVSFGSPVTLSFSTGDTQVVTTPSSATPIFAGFTFDESVAWVKIEATSTYAALDDFSYSELIETPEASTLLLAGAGLLSLLLARRLRPLGSPARRFPLGKDM